MTYLVALVVLLAAAVGESTMQLALSLATVAAALTPFLVGWIRRYVDLGSKAAALVSFAVAAVVAVVAAALTGELRALDWSSLSALLGTAGWLWLVQQAVFRAIVAKYPGAVGPGR